MGERKVLNKYIPSDFDPSLIPRGKKLSSKDGTVPVRMMLPFSMQCSTCNTFLYRGRKFNSKKEPMGGPEGKYLGITRFRFYIKCTQCARPITFLTDPERADYEMESGATRNYEVYKDQSQQEEDATATQAEEEKADPMKALENRVLDSQRQMADLDNLEEIRAMNARHVRMGDADAVLNRVHGSEESAGRTAEGDDSLLLTAEDEALVKSIRFGAKKKPAAATDNMIRRLNDDDELALERRRVQESVAMEQQLMNKSSSGGSPGSGTIMPSIKVVKRRKKRRIVDTAGTTRNNNGTEKDNDSNDNNNNNDDDDDNNGNSAEKKNKLLKTTAEDEGTKNDSPSDGGGLMGLLGGYGSDDSDSD